VGRRPRGPRGGRSSANAVRHRLAGEAVHYDPPVDAVRHTEEFLKSVSLETADLGAIEPRLVRRCHALDYLRRLPDDLQQLPALDAGSLARMVSADP
jgi:hypothetical protein